MIPEGETEESGISQEDYEKETIIKAIDEWDLNGTNGIIPQIPQRDNGFVGYDKYIFFIKVSMLVETSLLLVAIGLLLFR